MPKPRVRRLIRRVKLFCRNAKEHVMKARLEYGKVAPGALQAMSDVEAYVHHSGLEDSLLELVKTRASQINGCAYCLDMHTKDARANGGARRRSLPNGSARRSRGPKA